jgi:N-acetylneuraminate synthase
MYGSDAMHSAEPHQFESLVASIREVSTMLENPVDKDDVSKYSEMKSIFQKSIVFSRDLEEGTVIDLGCLAFKKPGDGISAALYRQLLGRKTCRKCVKDEKVREDCLQ